MICFLTALVRALRIRFDVDQILVVHVEDGGPLRPVLAEPHLAVVGVFVQHLILVFSLGLHAGLVGPRHERRLVVGVDQGLGDLALLDLGIIFGHDRVAQVLLLIVDERDRVLAREGLRGHLDHRNLVPLYVDLVAF